MRSVTNKLLLTMAAPMVLSMLIGALYNVVDSLFVSHYGENALSAVSLAFPIQNIIIATGTGIGVGINALLSRYLGEKKQKAVNQTAMHGIVLGIGFYVLILLFGIFCVKSFYTVQTKDAEIVSMGTKGAAIATVIGQIVAMLLGVYFNLTKNKDVQLSFKFFEFEGYYLKGICTVGIPTIIMQSMSSIMCFGINKLLLNFSTTSTAVFGAYFKLQTFVYMAIFGLNNALIGLVGLIIMEMLPVQLISAFAPSEEMFSLGVTTLRILGLSFVFGGISVMISYALQGFSRGISSLVVSALRQVIILLPLASILGKIFGINGIWWSFLISETVTVILAIIYLRIAEKKELIDYETGV